MFTQKPINWRIGAPDECLCSLIANNGQFSLEAPNQDEMQSFVAFIRDVLTGSKPLPQLEVYFLSASLR